MNKIFLVQADTFINLLDDIQDAIDEHSSDFIVQQIDYFCMTRHEPGPCSAFILFQCKNNKKFLKNE